MTNDKDAPPVSPNDEADEAADALDAPVAPETDAGDAGDRDVRTRLQDRVAGTKGVAANQARVVRERMTGAEGKPTPLALAVAGGLLALVAVLARLSLRTSKRSKRRR